MAANLSEAVIPRPLKPVACLFIIGGILSIADTVAAVFLGRLDINLGVLYVVVGLGLLRRRSRSLTWDLLCTWVGLILLPVFAVGALFLPGTLLVFGMNVGHMPRGLCFLLTAAMFLAVCWQRGVLTSRQVRALFVTPAQRPE